MLVDRPTLSWSWWMVGMRMSSTQESPRLDWSAKFQSPDFGLITLDMPSRLEHRKHINKRFLSSCWWTFL